MFMEEPSQEVDGIYDFISSSKIKENRFVNTQEEIAGDYKYLISVETSVLKNLVQVLSAEDFYARVLDIGCGSGVVLNAFRAVEKVALDVSLRWLRRADPFATRVRAFAEEMPFEPSYFQAVICFNVLEHVLYPEQMVKGINWCLEPGGVLFLACPWEQDLSVYEMPEYKRQFKQYGYKHLRSINEGTIKNLFPNYVMQSSTLITARMGEMKFKPYPVRFMKFVIKGVE